MVIKESQIVMKYEHVEISNRFYTVNVFVHYLGAKVWRQHSSLHVQRHLPVLNWTQITGRNIVEMAPSQSSPAACCSSCGNNQMLGKTTDKQKGSERCILVSYTGWKHLKQFCYFVNLFFDPSNLEVFLVAIQLLHWSRDVITSALITWHNNCCCTDHVT